MGAIECQKYNLVFVFRKEEHIFSLKLNTESPTESFSSILIHNRSNNCFKL